MRVQGRELSRGDGCSVAGVEVGEVVSRVGLVKIYQLWLVGVPSGGGWRYWSGWRILELYSGAALSGTCVYV